MNNDQINELLTLAREAQNAGDLQRAAMIYNTLAKYLTAQNSGADDNYLSYLVGFVRSGAN